MGKPEQVGRMMVDSMDAMQQTALTVAQMLEHTVQQENLAMRGILSASIGHELNNQLTVSLGNLEMAVQHLESGEWHAARERIGCASLILSEAGAMTQALFNGIRPERVPTLTQVNAVVTEFLFTLKPFLRKHQSSVTFALAEELPHIRVVETQFKQVLFNILRNAMQVRAQAVIKIETNFNDHNGMVQCCVHDNGPGMDHDMLDRLFKPFQGRNENGHGLGLCICREIINRFNGSLTVSSRLGSGTCFTISLPAETN
jgi:C4-dicarboxylate-specific signal transduction histidine kinase